MAKILNQHIEIVNLHEEIEDLRTDKKELEEEIRARNDEIYEINERFLFSDVQSKLLLEEQVKSFTDIQEKLENVFLNNQKKLIESSNIRNMIEKIRSEINVSLKENKLKVLIF